MTRDLYVVAIDDSAEQLSIYSEYFKSPAMKILGVRPTYVAVNSLEELKLALKNGQRPGILIIDGDLDSGISWESAVNANTAREVDSLDMIVLSNNPEVIRAAKDKWFTAAPKAAYVHLLKSMLLVYGKEGKS